MTTYDEVARRAGVLQTSPTLQKVAIVAGGLSSEMLDTGGKQAGISVTMIELAECLDRNEIHCKSTEATMAVYDLLALTCIRRSKTSIWKR